MRAILEFLIRNSQIEDEKEVEVSPALALNVRFTL